MPDPINGVPQGGGIPSPAPSAPAAPAAPAFAAPAPGPSAPAAPVMGGTPAPQGTAPSAPSLRDAMSARGYDVSQFADDDAFVTAFSEAWPYVENLPHLMASAQDGLRFREHQAEFEQWLASRGQQPPAAPAPGPAAAPAKKGWEAPPLDPAWHAHVRYDQETGRYVGRDMLSSPIAVEGMNRRADWQREQQQKFWDNPFEFMHAGLSDRFEQMLTEREQRILQSFQDQQRQASVTDELQGWLNDNMNFFYSIDQATGRPMVDPRSGQAVYTPAGQAFNGYCIQARQFGITDPLKVRDFAVELLRRDLALQQPAAPAGAAPAPGLPAGVPANGHAPNGAPPRGPDGRFMPAGAAAPPLAPVVPLTAGQRSQNLLDGFLARAAGAAHVPNRGGSELAAAAAGAAPQNPNMSFGEMAIAELRSRGAVPQTG